MQGIQIVLMSVVILLVRKRSDLKGKSCVKGVVGLVIVAIFFLLAPVCLLLIGWCVSFRYESGSINRFICYWVGANNLAVVAVGSSALLTKIIMPLRKLCKGDKKPYENEGPAAIEEPEEDPASIETKLIFKEKGHYFEGQPTRTIVLDEDIYTLSWLCMFNSTALNEMGISKENHPSDVLIREIGMTTFFCAFCQMFVSFMLVESYIENDL